MQSSAAHGKTAECVAKRKPASARSLRLSSPLRSRRGHASRRFLSRKALVRSRRLSRLPLGDRDSAASLLNRRFRVSTIPSCVDTDGTDGRRDLDPRLSLGQRERSSHRCRRTRCPNSSGPAVSSRSPQAFATPGRAAVERPGVPAAVVVGADEAGASRAGCATELDPNGSSVFVRVQAGADRLWHRSSRRRAWWMGPASCVGVWRGLLFGSADDRFVGSGGVT